MARANRRPCCVPETSARFRDAKVLPQMTSGDGMTADMVAVPGGRFLMGSNDAEGEPSDGEGPVREVILRPSIWTERRSRTVSSRVLSLTPAMSPPPSVRAGHSCLPVCSLTHCLAAGGQ